MNEGFSYTGREELEQARFLPRYNRHIAQLILKVIQPGQAVLDFGAGTGTISSLIRDGAKAASLTCIEIDPENIAALRKSGFTVIADAAEVSKNSADIVYSSNVLEHVDDDVAALKTLYAALKPGGRAVFWVPAFPCLWTGMDRRVGHVRRYTRSHLSLVFREAGFTVERCFYQDSLGFFAALLFRLIGDKDGTVSSAALKFYDRFVFPLSCLCDFLLSPLLGKNAVIYARKD